MSTARYIGGSNGGGSVWYTQSPNATWTSNYWTTSTTPVYTTGPAPTQYAYQFAQNLLTIPQGQSMEVALPDGHVIDVDVAGNFRIIDRDAKITYQANNIREFNRYVNASDLLEEFAEHVKRLKVNHLEFMDLPLELFINFLIIRAAEQDGEDRPQGILLEDHPKLYQVLLPPPKPLLLEAPKPLARCLNSGRFIPKSRKVPFLRKTDMLAYAEKLSW